MSLPFASLESKDIIGLLDDEELAELRIRLGISAEDVSEPFSKFSPADLLREVTKLRLPFVRMMNDISSLLGQLETSIRGNIRFVVLPHLASDLLLDFGPQMRRAIAKALNQKLLINHEDNIGSRLVLLQRQVRLICERVRAGPVARRNEIGDLLHRQAEIYKEGGLHAQSMRDEWMAENFFTETEYEFNPADYHSLKTLEQGLAEVQSLISKLAATRPSIQILNDLKRSFRRLSSSVKEKLASNQVSSGGWPAIPRTGEESQFTAVRKAIDDIREAVLAACDYVDALDDLYDFLNLQMWAQRWRVYELWVLARITVVLTGLGATINDTRRIIDGSWQLKFTKDSAPVLGFELEGEGVDLYYQFYQGRGDTGDMPDLAVRLRNGRFLAVIDPKHGYSYSRKDLNDVCERYADAFQPLLSCVCNYFPVRPTEVLRRKPHALVLYGFEPGDDAAIQTFQASLVESVESAYRDLGKQLSHRPALIVLFDGSGSAEKVRAPLLARFRTELVALSLLPRTDSMALIFSDGIVREGKLTELQEGGLLTGLVPGGTEFSASIRSALARLAILASPRQLWVFTDGEGLGDPLELLGELKDLGEELLLVEAGRSTLQPLADAIGARHIKV
jgi:hypothetical protein